MSSTTQGRPHPAGDRHAHRFRSYCTAPPRAAGACCAHCARGPNSSASQILRARVPTRRPSSREAVRDMQPIVGHRPAPGRRTEANRPTRSMRRPEASGRAARARSRRNDRVFAVDNLGTAETEADRHCRRRVPAKSPGCSAARGRAAGSPAAGTGARCRSAPCQSSSERRTAIIAAAASLGARWPYTLLIISSVA